jgi:predicted enzyme related to lactoylglutathione lyase
MRVRIEHAGIQVRDPGAVADWYVANLDFTCRRSSDVPTPVRFVADAGGQVMLEIYHNPDIAVPDYSAMDPLLLHVAFACDDVPGTVRKLVQAGAKLVSGPETKPNGDQLAMLRDPWGLAIQLCRRGSPMV